MALVWFALVECFISTYQLKDITRDSASTFPYSSVFNTYVTTEPQLSITRARENHIHCYWFGIARAIEAI